MKMKRLAAVCGVWLLLGSQVTGALEISNGTQLLTYQPGGALLRISEILGNEVPVGTLVARRNPLSGSFESATFLNRWLPDFEIDGGEWFYVDSGFPFDVATRPFREGTIELRSPTTTLQLIDAGGVEGSSRTFDHIVGSQLRNGTILFLFEGTSSTAVFPPPPIDEMGAVTLNQIELSPFIFQNGEWVPHVVPGGVNSTRTFAEVFDRLWLYDPGLPVVESVSATAGTQTVRVEFDASISEAGAWKADNYVVDGGAVRVESVQLVDGNRVAMLETDTDWQAGSEHRLVFSIVEGGLDPLGLVNGLEWPFTVSGTEAIEGPVGIQFEVAEGQLVLEFVGRLESATQVNGPFAEVTRASSPYEVPLDGTQRFFRVQ